MTNFYLTFAVALVSILWVELVRDCYHALSHVVPSLYRLHVWHHKVFRRDLTPVSEEIYRQAHWYHDVPEALVMLSLSFVPVGISYINQLPVPWLASAGSIYTTVFLLGAIARGLGVPGVDELTDITHRPGEFKAIPSSLFVNRPYHWRHHFDNQDAYFCGMFTLVDKFLGTALSLRGKKVAVTGASGRLGKALLKELALAGARVTAFTSSNREIILDINGEFVPIKTVTWSINQEEALVKELEKIDILILNHGINVHQKRSESAIAKSYEINAFSSLRLMDLFFKTVRTNRDIVTKEVWVNTSEAEVNPAFSPLYELSKRTLGDLVTLKRLDAPCIVRKLILGPFKSNLNPIGVMSADWVAKQIVTGAKRDFRNIIVTINPLTFFAFPIKEFCQFIYFKFFSNNHQNIKFED
ncbi:MAG: bifunctional sterol desaturase/short chain dehydrogenase [Cyanobacteria bacterium P01_F01_bin.143]